jgi:hypothetical protein
MDSHPHIFFNSISMHVFEEMLGPCEEEDLELLAVAARKIWFRRNFLVHGGISFILTKSFAKQLTLLKIFRELI